jgi:hypothetical protein
MAKSERREPFVVRDTSGTIADILETMSTISSLRRGSPPVSLTLRTPIDAAIRTAFSISPGDISTRDGACPSL